MAGRALDMSGSLNKATVIGNLGKDPDIRFMPDGSKVASFSVATNEYWEDKNTKERKERTEWHRISVFNERLVEVIEKYIKRGTKVYIEGRIQTRKWVDKTGAERVTTEIVLGKFRGEVVILDSKRADEDGFDDSVSVKQDAMPEDMLIDDEIPFG